VNTTPATAEDIAILEQLNLDYNHADQRSDAERFQTLLAEDFIVQTPGVTRNKDEYLAYIAEPRPFTGLALMESRIRLLTDDVALIHGRTRYTLLSAGSPQEALYTDVYQKRAGAWVCVAAIAIAPGS
jgi:hypothetical protein